MNDPERALQAAVGARLKGDAGVRAWLGVSPRVWDQPPEEMDKFDYPYLLFGRCETRPVAAEGCGYELRLRLTVVSRYGGSEEAKAVVAAARASLDGAALSLAGGWRCVDLRVTYADVFRAADLRSTHGLLRLRAVVEAG